MAGAKAWAGARSSRRSSWPSRCRCSDFDMPAPLLPAPSATSLSGRVRGALAIGLSALAAIAVVMALSLRAAHRMNRVALDAAPRPVTAVPAASDIYRDSRTFVGAVAPWVEAKVGPQYISAYVQTVLVRPGAVVKQGEVLATLDCSNPRAATRAVEMKGRALEASAQAAQDEAARMSTLLDGGFASPNDVEQKRAESLSEQAQFLETKANLLRSSLEVRDCILRAPFGGEIATRSFDPGGFVNPGASIVSVIDRDVVRVTVDAPEKDFDAVAPSTVVAIDIASVGAHLSAPIARRAPQADARTRTVRFEVDVPDPTRRYPVGTTAVVRVDVGDAIPSTRFPLYAATESEGKARFFVVEGDVAHSRTAPVLGEMGGDIFFEPTFVPAGTLVVTEGRALLSDGDRVEERPDDPGRASPSAGQASRGGGFGRPL